VSAQPCDTSYNDFKGPKSFYINAHNCGLLCATQELPYLELFRDGISGIRIAPVPRDNTAAPDPAFYTVNDFDPYFQGVLEIFGPENVLVLIDDQVDEGPHAKPSPTNILRLLGSVLDKYPQVRLIEFMNEPLNFSNITPEEYVARYLKPAREVIDLYNADRAPDNQLVLYSAAWFGNEDGVRQARRMIRSGGLAFADVLSAHIYARRAENAVALAASYKRMARGRAVAVTETNFNAGNRSNYESQFWWICESMTEIESLLRRGLAPEAQALQHNVLYTLRADEARLFNLIGFPDHQRIRFWANTGPGHVVIRERSLVPTDPKRGAAPPAGGGVPEGGGDPGVPKPGGRGLQ
jgi:hypothetical protein